MQQNDIAGTVYYPEPNQSPPVYNPEVQNNALNGVGYAPSSPPAEPYNQEYGSSNMDSPYEEQKSQSNLPDIMELGTPNQPMMVAGEGMGNFVMGAVDSMKFH